VAAVEHTERSMAEEIEAAAIVGFAGLDALAFIQMEDPLEQAVVLAVANRIVELKTDERQDLARLIRNEVVEGISG
jgi:hypothetical protein